MKTAVIISGQARTFDLCYPSQRWQVYRHYEPDLHFFVSVKDDEDADKMEVLRENHKNVVIQKLPDPEDADLFIPPEDAGRFAPYANAAGNKQLMLQHWGNKMALGFALKRIIKLGCEIVIRIRADLFFHSFIKPPNPFHAEAMTPWWGRFGGVNDRFAVMGAVAAKGYFNTYDLIPELLEQGCPFHPETLVYESMMKQGVMVRRDLRTTFSTIRKNGQQRPPEIMLEDLADLHL